MREGAAAVVAGAEGGVVEEDAEAGVAAVAAVDRDQIESQARAVRYAQVRHSKIIRIFRRPVTNRHRSSVVT